MRCRQITLLVSLTLGYGIVSLLSAYFQLVHHLTTNTDSQQFDDTGFSGSVDIFDNSGVGLYLWEHILNGPLLISESADDSNGWSSANHSIKNILFRYNFNYGALPLTTTFHGSDGNVVLAVNGRDEKVQHHARTWITSALDSPNLKNLALVVLGEETCTNDWLTEYLDFDVIKVIFMVYDSPLIDEKRIFQWPLGVASYRNFPVIDEIDISSQRRYLCNFVGTYYPGGSRELLKEMTETDHFFTRHGEEFKFVWRDSWTDEEPIESSERYQDVVCESDLTLSPVGMNSECYRTYEAIELGSIPIIENRLTSPNCNNSSPVDGVRAPYKLLKRYNAPVYYVSELEEIHQVIDDFRKLSPEERVQMRTRLMNWNQEFKTTLKSLFIEKVKLLFS